MYYPQYSSQPQQYYLNQPTLLSQNPQPQQLQFPSRQPLQIHFSQFPQRPTHLPTQTIPNLNNNVAHPAYNMELQKFPMYMITPTDLNNIHLRIGRVLDSESHVIFKEQNEEEISIK